MVFGQGFDSPQVHFEKCLKMLIFRHFLLDRKCSLGCFGVFLSIKKHLDCGQIVVKNLLDNVRAEAYHSM